MRSGPLFELPLNDFQILGVPPSCDETAIVTAVADRLAQLPRRELSSQVSAQREALIKESGEVLVNAVRHQEPVAVKHLTVSSEGLAAGLLLLYEAGCYKALLERKKEVLAIKDNQDTRLIFALAHRAVAEEEDEQGNLEAAYSALELGITTLREGNCLVPVQQELSALSKRWRPEYILSLLSGEKGREAGMMQLLAMLEERSGLEGDGKDGSGLNPDEFFKFMQYVRRQLNVVEQQDLFEQESARPSPAAQYLAAQALLARGFSQAEAQWIRRARGHLIKLSQRQDVNLELAVCALLLGQVDEALKNLERSQEEQPLNFIRNISANSPDLLPGLCRYSEEWLSNEVFPLFRDLRDTQSSLQDYFSNPEVQNFIDKAQTPPTVASLPNEAIPPLPPPEKRPRRRTAVPTLLPVGGAFLAAVLLLGSGWVFSQNSKKPEAVSQKPIPKSAKPWAPKPSAAPAIKPEIASQQPDAPKPVVMQSASAAIAPLTEAAPSNEQVKTLIMDWQQVKQQALGSTYQTEGIATLLTGRAKQVWQAKASQAKEAQEHWQYTFNKLAVEKIDRVSDQELAVTAEVSEIANVYSARGRKLDNSYTRPYRVRYMLLREADGWRISRMDLL
jgi:ARC6-like, IMS domain